MAWLVLMNNQVRDVNKFERKVFSQHGEDGIIRIILRKVGLTNKFCVEFGVQDGKECCTRYLVEKEGWRFLWMDGSYESPSITREFITAENINLLLAKYKVPSEFDVLSIDIDYNTYWVWKQIKGYSPRVVVVEYNGFIPCNMSKAVEYLPDAVWDGSQYFGASLLALVRLGRDKGYTLIGCDSSGCNAFFVRRDLVKGYFQVKDTEKLYKPAIGAHPPTDKLFVDV